MSVCVCVRARGGREKGHIELRMDGVNMSAEVLSVFLSLSVVSQLTTFMSLNTLHGTHTLLYTVPHFTSTLSYLRHTCHSASVLRRATVCSVNN